LIAIIGGKKMVGIIDYKDNNLEHAFEILNAYEVFSIIRDTNIASQNVAKRNGVDGAKLIKWIK